MATTYLRRGFSGITLTTNDLRTIHRWAAKIGPVDVRANGARLMAIEQVETVIAEDVVLERFEMSVADRDDRLDLSYDQSSLMLRCEDGNPRLRAAYDAIVDLLSAKPSNGIGRCMMEVSAPASWQAPRTPPRLRALPPSPTPGTLGPGRTAQPGRLPWWRRLPWPGRSRQLW